MIALTPHPRWVENFLNQIEECQRRVVNHKVFGAIISGELSEAQFSNALLNFYPLIETFPKYLALILAKVPPGDSDWNRKTRSWLISNISQERRHAEWWRHWAIDFGVDSEKLEQEIYSPAEMDAINNYLWRICTHGSLAEAISAANFAVEGPTGMWTKNVAGSVSKYNGVGRIKVTKKTLEWVEEHANYDDKHPVEALELVKYYATTEAEREKVIRAAMRSLEYYAMALDFCYREM